MLIDLKTGKLTHQDIGQMDMYVRLYDKEYNRTGYSKAYKDKKVMFDKSWNRNGYKKWTSAKMPELLCCETI